MDKAALKAEKHVAKELDVRSKDVDKAVQETPAKSADPPAPGLGWLFRPPSPRHRARGGHMRATFRPGTRRWLLLPAAVLGLSGLAAGCSSSKPAYCTAASHLKTSVNALGNITVNTTT